MMLNNPAGISPAMDVAKMLAMDTMVRRVVAPEVTVLREVRAGLFSLPPDPVRALGQLASATRTAMLLSPDIIHVVGHTEAHHAIEAAELITACSLVHQVIDDALLGLPDSPADPKVAARRDLLIAEAEFLLSQIATHHPGALDRDPDPDQLGSLVRSGILDAPQLAGNPAAHGEIVTVVDGGCDAGAYKPRDDTSQKSSDWRQSSAPTTLQIVAAASARWARGRPGPRERRLMVWT